MLLASHSCRFGTFTPALLHLLATVEAYARDANLTVVIISATDSQHSNEAHARGEAIDLRCADAAGNERQLLSSLLTRLGPAFSGKVGTRFRERPHLHLQLRPGAAFHVPAPPASRFDSR